MFIRERALVVNFENIRLIITRDEVRYGAWDGILDPRLARRMYMFLITLLLIR